MTNRHSRPEDLFRAEKERASSDRNSQHARLLAEAKAAFDKLMAEGQAARKSGRPRKHPLPPLKTSSARPFAPAPMAAAKPAAVIAAPVTKAAAAGPPAAAKASVPAKSAKPAAASKLSKAVHVKKVTKAAAKPKAQAKRSSRR